MKKKIKKYSGGALSAVDSSSIQSSSMDKDLVLNPELSVRKMGDDIMDPKQTISSKSLGIEKGYKFVLHTGNMIFIRNDLFDKLNISYNNPLENFRTCFGAR